MSFDNVRLPLDIERGVKVSPEFAVSKVRLSNGFSRSLLRQNFPLRKWDIAYGLQGLTGVLATEGLLAIYKFYMARGGTLNTFRMRDWLDFQLVQEVIGTGDGVETIFQIIKTNTDFGSFTRVENITKPSNNAVDPTTIVRYNAVVKTEGSDFTIDYSTGLLTSTSAVPDTEDIDITVNYDRHVSFEKSINFELALETVGRVKKISVTEER